MIASVDLDHVPVFASHICYFHPSHVLLASSEVNNRYPMSLLIRVTLVRIAIFYQAGGPTAEPTTVPTMVPTSTGD